jgi:uncharacterized protein YwqG
MATWSPEEAINTLMDRFARPCIRIHRPFPPLRKPLGRSKLGGLPNLPPEIEWPYGRSHQHSSPTRTPLQFLAQIDCCELPHCDHLLPSSGMLFFFANTFDDGSLAHDPDDFRRVVFAPRVEAETPVRQPPADMPEVTPHKGIGGIYPSGYSFAQRPDDPLTRKIYFEWPVEFAVIDSYPDTDAVRRTPAWAGLEADWNARAQTDEAFRTEFGAALGMLDIYQEARSERMFRAFYAALKMPEPPRSVDYRPPAKVWRQISDELGSFPPTTAFASEIAAAIDYFMENETAEAERSREMATRLPSPPASIGMLQRLLRRLVGGASSPPSAPNLPALPDWIDDIRIVRQEAAAWFDRMRSLPADHELDAQTRERFLAWLDDLEERNWARIPGHPPRIFNGVRYPFGRALFQLARLSASQDVVRTHFPDALFRHGMLHLGGGAHYQHHQMLGWFGSSQEPRRVSDHVVHLLQLSYDDGPDFRFGDGGELQFFITERDLRARNFSRVDARMQGG